MKLLKIGRVFVALLVGLALLMAPAYSVSATASLPSITAVYITSGVPASANNGTTTTVTVTGSNLTGVTEVSFYLDGVLDPLITSGNIKPDRNIPDSKFNVDIATEAGAVAGARNVKVTTPSGDSAAFANGFTIYRATVMVSTPGLVSPGSTFWVDINVADVANLNASQFDLSYDNNMIYVTGDENRVGVTDGVTNGAIPDSGTTGIYPQAGWSFLTANTIRVLGHMAGVNTVTGSGYLHRINFAVKATAEIGAVSPITLSEFGIFNSNAGKIIPDVITQGSITVTELSISDTSLPEGTAGVTYAGGILSAVGGTTPYNWIASGLPAGLTIGATTGIISGTPTESGEFAVAITVTDSAAPTPHVKLKTLNLKVYPDVQITTGSLPQGVAGSPYQTILSATGGKLPIAWSATGLPAPLTVDSVSGMISGTPVAEGDFIINITVADAFSPANTDHRTLSLHIDPIPHLVSLAVTPDNPVVVAGNSQQFNATGTYSDSSTHNLNTAVTWSSSDTIKATIGVDTGLAKCLTAGTTTITASLGEISGHTTLTVTPAPLVSLAVSPTNSTVVAGIGQQFSAIGTYSDNSTQNLTASVTWSSSDTAKATIGVNSGLAKGLSAGTTIITASLGAISDNTTLTVTPAPLVSLAVTPINPEIVAGVSRQFSATGIYSDNSTQNLTTSVTWSSSDITKATIGVNTGLVTCIAAGPTIITASLGAISDNTTLTVTPAPLVRLAVTPANPVIVAGISQQFSATGTYSDNSTQNLTASVTWSSSDTAKATIGVNTGLARCIAVGPTTITASLGAISDNTTLTVSPAPLVRLEVTPSTISLARGLSQQFSAAGTYSDNLTRDLTSSVIWSSSDPVNVTIDNLTGLATASGVTASAVTITASAGGIQDSALVTVTPSVCLSLDPASKIIKAGETFEVAIKAECVSQPTDRIDIYLNYDPAQLEVVDADNDTQNGIQITPGNALPMILNITDNVTGLISYSSGSTLGATGTFTVATVQFKNKAVVDQTMLTFRTSVDNLTRAEYGGIDFTGKLSGGKYLAPPTVTISPFNGSTAIAVNSPIVLTFSKVMHQPSVQGAFSILPAVSGAFSWGSDNKSVTFTPASSLANSTNYTIGLGTAAVDTDGVPLATAFTSTFTTVGGSSSGGGGSSGSPPPSISLSGFKVNTALAINSSGILQSAVKLQTMDDNLTLELAKGTKLLGSSNLPLTNIKVTPLVSPPTAPEGNAIVLAYSFTPEGAKFDPALTLTFKYNSALLPPGISESELYIAYFDGTQWQKLTTTVDPVTKTVTAKLAHFSHYALIGKVNPAPVTVTPSPTKTIPAQSVTPLPTTPILSSVPPTSPAASPALTSPSKPSNPVVPTSSDTASVTATTADSTKPSSTPWGLILGIMAGVVVVLIIAVLLTRKSKKP